MATRTIDEEMRLGTVSISVGRNNDRSKIGQQG
jgi:hypothetical protein